MIAVTQEPMPGPCASCGAASVSGFKIAADEQSPVKDAYALWLCAVCRTTLLLHLRRWA